MAKKRRRTAAELASAAKTAPKISVSSERSGWEWTVHLARHQPFKATLTVVAVSLAPAFGWLWVHPLIGLAAGAFLLGAVSEFLFPVRYRVTKEGAEAVGFLFRRSLSWRQVKRISLSPDGLRLSPYPSPTPLESFRGLTLRWTGDERTLRQLLHFCERRIAAERATPPTAAKR